ncbi:MAG: hypothetical protein LBT83_05665 [Tannerella sp.]|jgi:hypothetical protein|nr:hypothetical protein [Tannerella sp.]
MENTELYKNVISERNIYNAIYSLESYVFEKGLLSDDDIELYNKLSDKYDFKTIDIVIKDCQEQLKLILQNPEELFEIKVFFKLKKYDSETEKTEFRPIHTADLKTQICIVCLLNQIMFEDEKKRELSELSRLIPSNFYGNIPSAKMESIFASWKVMYKNYTENVIEKFHEHKENGTYKNEVCLDIKNFFPSINPIIIYKLITDKISYDTEDEQKLLKTIVYKLLYFELKELDSAWVGDYYGSTNLDKTFLAEKYAKGIVQGLPQSYFFGNLCMVEIAKFIEDIFDGDACYYVDDSVIYTNEEEDKFKYKLKELNISIRKFVYEYISGTNDVIIPASILSVHRQLEYGIEVHTEEKSSITPLQEVKNIGQIFLRNIAGVASNVGALMFTTIDELDDTTLHKKLVALDKIISKKLDLVKQTKETKTKETDDNYIKQLKRYKKFFLFRLKCFEYKDECVDEKTDSFIERYEILQDNRLEMRKELSHEDKESFFEQYDEDIFIAEIDLMIRFKVENLDKLLEKINKLEDLLPNEQISSNNNQLYYKQTINGLKKLELINKLDPYKSLESRIHQAVKPCAKLSKEKELNELSKIINNDSLNERLPEYTHFAYYTSDEFKRKILNGLCSHVINIGINDRYEYIKKDNRPLMYFELRLLIYLRNRHFNYNEFCDFAKKILNEAKSDEYAMDKIDYHVLEILSIFNMKVKDPKNIDTLILTHKLVNGLWKNGSKFLHFYTLHNEEHAIELIKNCVKISNAIDYFKLKDIDYFILFLSCYLHDISMVLHPNSHDFCKDSPESDAIYTEWISNIQNKSDTPKQDIKQFLLDYFKKIDSYFEKQVRHNHHKLSATFIKRKHSKYLEFVKKTTLQVVADVSESHGFDCAEVYGRKSSAKDDIFSTKYLMVMLRLADLLDISKDRVNYYLLKENIRHMDKDAQFHWISHLVTEKCDIMSEYDVFEPIIETENPKTYLKEECIKESFKIDIYLNVKQLTNVPYPKCTKISSTIERKANNLCIRIGEDNEECTSKSCPFICKWMKQKHNYLFDELFELKKYLSSANNGLFKTEFNVNLHYSNGKRLDPEFMDIIRDYFDHK